jgi:hypothetical protein
MSIPVNWRRLTVPYGQRRKNIVSFCRTFGNSISGRQGELEFLLIHGYVKDISGMRREILEKRLTLKELIHPEDIRKVMSDIDNLKMGAVQVIDNEYRISRKTGR